MKKLALLKSVALGALWLCVAASLLSRNVTGEGFGIMLIVAIIMTWLLV